MMAEKKDREITKVLEDNTNENGRMEETALYRNIVEDSAIGVLVADRRKRSVLYSNEAFAKICGFREDSIVGRRIRDLLRDTEKKEILTTEEIRELSFDVYSEFHISRRGLYLAIKAKAVKWNGIDSYILYIADETNEHQNQLRLQKIIDEVPAGIGICEVRADQVTLTYLNEAYYHMAGLNKKKAERFFEKNHALDGIHRDDHGKIREMLQKVNAGADSENVIVRMLGRGNTWTWFHLSLSIVERKENYLKGYAAFSNCDDVMKAQEEMRRNYIKEQTLMKSIPGGTAIYRIKKDGRTVVEYASDGYCELFGYTREEILSYSDISQLVFEEDLSQAKEVVNNALHKKENIYVFYRIVTKDHHVLLNKLDAKVMVTEELQDDDVAVIYAVHSKVSDETKLARQEQKYYRMILSMTGTAYCEWDMDKGFYSSKEYENYALSEGGFDALMGRKNGKDAIHPEDMSVVMFYMNEIIHNVTGKSITIRMKMKDGHYQWTEVTSFAQKNPEGNFVRLVGVFRDVDKEWIEKNRKLQEALEIAKKANRAKTAFLSRVSHDMRTPLNGILGLTAFLKETVKDEQALEDISQLEISGQYLLNLINDTLDVSRIENGKLELHPVVCDGKTAFDNLLRLMKPNIEAKHISFSMHAKNLNFTMLYLDIGRVEQIIMNIIGNAVKFTPEGGKIEYQVEHISETEQVILDKISIRDSGIGMSKEFLPTIFDAFSQADDTQTNTRQGTGLGMAITKQLVDVMGGEIAVESELGKGTCFTILLPLPKASKQQIREWEKNQSVDTDQTLLQGKHVLLCEDHPLNTQIAVRLLEQKGMYVTCAKNGKEGLEFFKQSRIYQYDVILMDIRMPIMDGLATTRKIRALERVDAHTVPIIAMTGNSFEEDVEQVIGAGMNAHLSKPIDAKKLFDTISQAVSATHYFRRKKVLVVDDIHLNRAVIRMALEADYDLLEADCGLAALEILKKTPDIDAVITDIMMPVMDGMELIRQIRSSSKYQKIALIANTQYGELAQEEDLLKIGANAIIHKPTTPENVAAQLRKALKIMEGRQK